MVAEKNPMSTKIFQNREKTFIIVKKLSESRKKIGIQKNISEPKKFFMKSRKKNQNREKKFKIAKNISESRKMFQNQEIFCYKNPEEVFGIECFYNIFV